MISTEVSGLGHRSELLTDDACSKTNLVLRDNFYTNSRTISLVFNPRQNLPGTAFLSVFVCCLAIKERKYKIELISFTILGTENIRESGLRWRAQSEVF